MTTIEIIKEAESACKRTLEEFGLADLPDNVQARLNKVYKTDADAYYAAKRALGATEIACLAAWSRGDIEGPETESSLENKARKAESLSKLFASRGEVESAEKQRLRAEELRTKVYALRGISPGKIAEKKCTPVTFCSTLDCGGICSVGPALRCNICGKRKSVD